MSVTERVMGVGAWSLDLHPETPRRILSQLDPTGVWGFAQLVVTDVPVDVASMTDAGVLAVARYGGVYRSMGGLTLSGAGLAALLGDEDGKGNVFEAEISGSYDAGTWASVLTEWTGLTIKGVEASGSWSNAFRWVTAREALADVCAHFGHEWRVTADLGYHQGSITYLYPSTPALVVLTDDDGGTDWGVTGVRGEISRSVDVEDHAKKVVYLTSRGDTDPPTAPTWTTATRTDSYRDPLGRDLIIDALVEAHVQDGDPTALAAAELGKLTARRSWDVAADRLPHNLVVGAPVCLWAPAEDVCDLSQPVYYRGRTIFPAASRLMGATWPITPSMGVYLRRKPSETTDAVWLDLTRYVVGETGGVQLEIGATPRPSR